MHFCKFYACNIDIRVGLINKYIYYVKPYMSIYVSRFRDGKWTW